MLESYQYDKPRRNVDQLRQSFLEGNLSEFPDGIEPEAEMLYVRPERPNRLALDYTDQEWSLIAAWRDCYDEHMAKLGDLPFDDANLMPQVHEWVDYYISAEAEHWREDVDSNCLFSACLAAYIIRVDVQS